MITKKYIKSRNVYKVTFTLTKQQLPETVDVESVAVAGDFNHWHPQETPFKYNRRNKMYIATVELPAGARVAFRYVANDRYWFNDWGADDYAPNGYGTHNCVIETQEFA